MRRLWGVGIYNAGPYGDHTGEIAIRTRFEMHPDGKRAVVLFDRVVPYPSADFLINHMAVGELWLPAADLARIFDGIEGGA